MTKKKIILACIILFLLILFVPIPMKTKDDGTKVYAAGVYKIVKWNKTIQGQVYNETKVYYLISRFQSLEKLWEQMKDYRPVNYNEDWVQRATAQTSTNKVWDPLIITEIYANCFFAESQSNLIGIQYRFAGSLSEDWCVGDRVCVISKNAYYSEKDRRWDCDMDTIEISTYVQEPGMAAKPVIYLYPLEPTEVSVQLDYNGELTCTYPNYQSGWNVTAFPDGTLVDEEEKSYNYLYWEGEAYTEYDFSEGFCVKGEDTAAFLEEALEKLGLTRREANEFIVYWLPLMEVNPYNVIAFQSDAYTENAELNITPSPDTLIRVFMAWKGVDTYVKIKEQKLSAPDRVGFTVVEWGGTEVK